MVKNKKIFNIDDSIVKPNFSFHSKAEWRSARINECLMKIRFEVNFQWHITCFRFKEMKIKIKRSKQRIDMKKIAIILVISMVCFGLSFSYCHAKNIKTIEGLIESKTDDSITVRGKDYRISGAHLEDASGKNMTKDQIKTGRKVEIFFENNRIKTILLYPEYMAE